MIKESTVIKEKGFYLIEKGGNKAEPVNIDKSWDVEIGEGFSFNTGELKIITEKNPLHLDHYYGDNSSGCDRVWCMFSAASLGFGRTVTLKYSAELQAKYERTPQQGGFFRNYGEIELLNRAGLPPKWEIKNIDPLEIILPTAKLSPEQVKFKLHTPQIKEIVFVSQPSAPAHVFVTSLILNSITINFK
ncbi:MAG: hypothetical protein HQM09_24595 [Candidatus Riflebacteria bacterium]|nr:hypothetical protein [Candidatus Riflebacteria bacterium]